MSKAMTGTCVGVVGVAATVALCLLSAVAQEPKGVEQKRDVKPESLVGAWTTEERHLAMGSLFQPHHATRVRSSTVYFKQDGDKLTGYSVTPDHTRITGQKDWKDGRTDFRTVAFAAGKLVFEFDIKDIVHGSGRRVKSKAVIRVEAVLKDDRLVGKWGLFLPDGSEPFRGEFEAERAKDEKKK